MVVVAESRSSPRVVVTEFMVGLPDGDLTVRGNISSGGVGFLLDDLVRIRVGDPIAIRVAIPDENEPLVLAAAVRHAHYREPEGVFYVGASFLDVDALVQNPLDRFVEEEALLEKTPSGGVMMPGF